ncbi:MAG TPA: hypothetical protein PK733_14535 [Clostridiales bacterium]|nr:hypothetical protein [Clostridiales bacterium]
METSEKVLFLKIYLSNNAALWDLKFEKPDFFKTLPGTKHNGMGDNRSFERVWKDFVELGEKEEVTSPA